MLTNRQAFYLLDTMDSGITAVIWGHCRLVIGRRRLQSGNFVRCVLYPQVRSLMELNEAFNHLMKFTEETEMARVRHCYLLQIPYTVGGCVVGQLFIRLHFYCNQA
jgi:hypothetical protein